jgi:hypothetical protein
MFLTEKPDSGKYENRHTRRKSSQSNPIKGFKSGIKRQCRHRGVSKTTIKMKVQRLTILTYISQGNLA